MRFTTSKLLSLISLVLLGRIVACSSEPREHGEVVAGGAAGSSAGLGGSRAGTQTGGSSGATGAGTGASGQAGTGADAQAGTGGQDGGAAGSAGSGGDAGVQGSGGADGSLGSTGTDGGSGVENCSNGRDDDGDGNPDCTDTDCLGHLCIPAAPTGWSGPFLLYEGPSAGAPSCSGEVGTQVFNGGTQPAQTSVTCSSCGCGSVSSAATPTCRLSGTCYAGGVGGACTTQACTFSLTNACYVPSSPTGYVFGSFAASGGGCQPSGGSVSNRPAPTWQAAARGCGLSAAAQAGCAAGSTCFPPPRAPFLNEICVSSSGNNACPAAYPNKHAYFIGFNDTRSCTACQCGTPTGLSCTGTVTAYSQTNCTGGTTTQFEGTAGQCQFVANTILNDVALRLENTQFSGSCQPTSASTSTGVIQGTSQTTVCCR